jgi:hypothetical protein
MMDSICPHDVSEKPSGKFHTPEITHLTGPIPSRAVFVSSVRGVEASTHTSPLDNLMAVERPPKGIKPNRKNGLDGA